MPSYTPQSLDQYDRILKSSPLVIVCFYVTWSEPCKRFLPVYEAYSNSQEYSMFDFYKVDCDYEPMIKNYSEGRPHEKSIETIPACFVFKNGVKVDQEIGTEGLPNLLRRNLPRATPAYRQPDQIFYRTNMPR